MTTPDGDSVRKHYAEVSYPGGAFTRTHPARQAAIARLFGLAPPTVRTARVLEVGCAQGYNLLPLAARFPDARFVGVDFSAHEIERGRALAADAGLTNVELVCADLRDFSPGPGSFDYIIAHGFLSWVPDDVKSALFALCASALAPGGLAYVSYNTYPGWKQREALRELMLLRAGSAIAPAARIASARSTLATLERLFDGRPEHHAGLNREIIDSLKKKRSEHLYHDDLEGVNDPCYFLQFTAWAAEQGLAYLAEAEWETMFAELLPASVRPALAEFADDRLMLEQHLDFLRNRTFRSSLLHRAGAAVRRDPDPAALRACSFGTPLRPPVGVPSLAPGTPVRFGAGSPFSFESRDPLVKAVFTVLASAWPRRLACPELLDAARRLLAASRVDPPADFESQLLARLLDACGRRLVDFMTDCGLDCASSPPPAPQADRLARLMADRGLPVVNTWHEMAPIEPHARSSLPSMEPAPASRTPSARSSKPWPPPASSNRRPPRLSGPAPEAPRRGPSKGGGRAKGSRAEQRGRGVVC